MVKFWVRSFWNRCWCGIRRGRPIRSALWYFGRQPVVGRSCPAPRSAQSRGCCLTERGCGRSASAGRRHHSLRWSPPRRRRNRCGVVTERFVEHRDRGSGVDQKELALAVDGGIDKGDPIKEDLPGTVLGFVAGKEGPDAQLVICSQNCIFDRSETPGKS